MPNLHQVMHGSVILRSILTISRLKAAVMLDKML